MQHYFRVENRHGEGDRIVPLSKLAQCVTGMLPNMYGDTERLVVTLAMIVDQAIPYRLWQSQLEAVPLEITPLQFRSVIRIQGEGWEPFARELLSTRPSTLGLGGENGVQRATEYLMSLRRDTRASEYLSSLHNDDTLGPITLAAPWDDDDTVEFHSESYRRAWGRFALSFNEARATASLTYWEYASEVTLNTPSGWAVLPDNGYVAPEPEDHTTGWEWIHAR